MNSNPNLLFAWLWILLGFVSGLMLGMFFHRENWLGGYDSFKRRLYRLAHISFFGLGAVNLLFWLTVHNAAIPGMPAAVASWAFIAGGVTMPVSCVIMAHFPKARLVFAVPVLSLITGGALMLLALIGGVGASPSISSSPPGHGLETQGQDARAITTP